MKTFTKNGLAAGALAATLCVGVFIGQAVAAQGHMAAALTNLTQARSQLQAASTNKAGHRVNALRYIDLAAGEVRAGIAAGDR